MIDTINEIVYFKTLDESPKFRADNIKNEINLNPELVLEIIEVYNLNLVQEVYLQAINIKSYNGPKRNKLKVQEIILIKKLKAYELMLAKLEEMFSEAVEYEHKFRKYFDYPFSFEEDRVFVESMLKNYYQDISKRYPIEITKKD